MERLWSSLADMLPSAAKLVSIRWFKVLVQVMVLKYNYRPFHAKRLPTWTENDALLAERVENLAWFLWASVDHDQDADAPAGQAIFDSFLV